MKYIFALLFPFLLMGQNQFSKEEITISEFVKGTLYKPAKPNEKLVIVVAGSGPTNRDGNQPGGRSNAYKMLAEGVVTQGTAVFCFDKRIVGQLIAGKTEEGDLRFEDQINDLRDIVTRFEKEYPKIVICGHSEGSLIGMVAAQEKVQGYISLAGAGRSIDQVITEQVVKQAPFLENQVKQSFATLKEGKTFKLENQLLAALFREDVQPFMISWMKYDPTAEIKKLQIPILIINGTKDIQVPPSEAQLLKDAKPDAKLVIIENMNHVLKEIEKDQDNLPSYNNPEMPVSAKLIESVNQFVNRI